MARIVGDILARAAVEKVGAGPAGEPVVSAFTIQLVRARRTIEPVAPAGAAYILHARPHIAVRPVPGSFARCKTDPHRAQLAGIICASRAPPPVKNDDIRSTERSDSREKDE